MATKTVDLRQLRRELIIREWTRIFKNFRYLGFVGFTKGVPWRRLFLRQRVTEGLSEVEARFCKPWEGREVTEKLGYSLFWKFVLLTDLSEFKVERYEAVISWFSKRRVFFERCAAVYGSYEKGMFADSWWLIVGSKN